ncbi:MAG: sigma-54 dependent transcriptional regulator, partial [Pseudomonadota bacterium]
MTIDVLVVDDEEDIRELIGGLLEDEGYNARLAADSDEALAAVQERLPALMILDIWLQGSRLDGLEVLDEVKAQHHDLPVVVISGHGTIETAVSAIKRGAYDFVEKPFKADRLVLLVQRALEASRLKRENTELRAQTNRLELIGRSPAIAQVRQVIDKVADARSRVLITGPSGSGKEVIARLIHAKSSRADAPFVAVNAAAIAPDRMEIELFGIEGAADAPRKVGLFEQAHGGTLLLDEVGDMPLETQGKILRVLVDQTFERVGSGARVQVDVRVISSTS